VLHNSSLAAFSCRWLGSLAVVAAMTWTGPIHAQEPEAPPDSSSPIQALAWNAGLQRVVGPENTDFSTPWRKTATAFCPVGKWVLGGGARIIDSSASSDPNRPRLSVSFPYHDRFGGRDFFYAHAEVPETDPTPVDFTLEAYAVCASPSALDLYQVVTQASARNTAVFKDAAAVCPSGTVAFGSGGYIAGYGTGEFTYGGQGRIGLQLVRTSGPLDITRATARAQGYSGGWEVEAVAVCARRQGNVHVEGALSLGAEVSAGCPNGYHVAGPGGGGGLTDGGPVWLRKIYPTADLKRVEVSLTAPLNPSIGGMIAHFTCVQDVPGVACPAPKQCCGTFRDGLCNGQCIPPPPAQCQ
jgi:hypothetical protein